MVRFRSNFCAMNQSEADLSIPRFYFALPRLMARWRGGDSSRAEQNPAEAWIAGLAVYAVSYLFFFQLTPAGLRWWQAVPLWIVLAFLVWLFWLLVLYLDSLVIRFGRLIGLFRTIPDRRAQSILIGTTTTGMACALIGHGSWISEIGVIWIISVVMNMAAAALLALGNGSRVGS